MKIEITPVIVNPDMSPLIHLAAAGRLDLLQAFGERGLIASAEEIWTKIIEGAAGANPNLAVRIMQPKQSPEPS